MKGSGWWKSHADFQVRSSSDRRLAALQPLIKEPPMSRSLLCCFLFIILAASGVTYAGVFDIEEIKVAPSPAEEKYLELKHTEKVLDFDVAKDGPQAAILIENQTGGGKVVFWNTGAPQITEE